MRRAFTLIIMTFVLTMPRTGVAQPLVFFDTVNPPFMYEYNGTVTGIYPRLIGEAFSIIGGTPKVAAQVAVRDINDGLDLLLEHGRLVATLRC